MKAKLLFAVGLIAAGTMLGASFWLEPAHADQGQGWPGARIYVIDIAKVFRGYEKYKSLVDNFKGQAEAKENTFQAKQEELRGKLEVLNELIKQPDRDRVEREISDLKVELGQLKRKFETELVQGNADIHSTVYKEVTDMLKAYCVQNGIHMVLRLSDEIDNPDPRMVMQTVTREVVYHHENLDLTQVITEGLNTKFKANPGR